MRHGFAKRRLNRTVEHRAALLRSLSCALIKNGIIKTTLPKAKELRPYFEKMLTLARKNSLHSRRLLIARLHDIDAVKKLENDFVTRSANRNGGYLRIVKAGYRYGDCAPMAYVEFVDRELAIVEAPVAAE